jgi:hypothetical protein
VSEGTLRAEAERRRRGYFDARLASFDAGPSPAELTAVTL